MFESVCLSLYVEDYITRKHIACRILLYFCKIYFCAPPRILFDPMTCQIGCQYLAAWNMATIETRNMAIIWDGVPMFVWPKYD